MSGRINISKGATITVPNDFCGNHWSSELPSYLQGRHFRVFSNKDTNWWRINTSAGVYNWGILDRYVAAWGARPWTYVVWGTPTWASARPSEVHQYGNGLMAEPSSMTYLSDFITQVVTRYPTMTHIEVWNEPDMAAPLNPPYWFSGSVATFVTMCQTIYNAAKAVRTSIKVLGPGTVNYLSSPNWLDAFFAAGGASYLDAVSIHGYQIQYATPLKAFLGLSHQLNYVQKALSAGGVTGKDLYMSEFGQLNPTTESLPDEAYLIGYKRAMVTAAALGFKYGIWFIYDADEFGYSGRVAVEEGIRDFINLFSGSTLSNVWLNVPEQTVSATINGVSYEF